MAATESGPEDESVKLIIQIPCYNEEETLGNTLDDLPQSLPGVDTIETLVIDDGSTDDTVQVAQQHNVDHVVSHKHNKGLAVAFRTGLTEALRQGADIVVNTDGDNVFQGQEVTKLIEPIHNSQADIVVGERRGPNRDEFSLTKSLLHYLGTFVVRQLSNTELPDVTCGFRAYTREAALRLNVISRFSYTLETIIQAGIENLSITSVPIQTNPSTRESRLFRNYWHYVKNSINTIIRVFITYRPLKFFGTLGSIIFTGGFLLGCRYIYLFLMGDSGERFQSLLLSAVFLIIGFLVVIIGLVADVISANRKLLQEIVFLERKRDLEQYENSDG